MELLSFENYSLWLNAAVFVAAGVCVWFAGSKLSVLADVISERTGLGHAFVGLLLLATATSLPEVATATTAAAIGNAQLVTGNLLGGILMQTTLLAAMDLLLVRRGVLTFFAPDAKLMINGVMLVALLSLVVAGIAAGGSLALWGISIWTPLIFACYLLILWTTYSGGEAQWYPRNPPEPDRPKPPRPQDEAQLEGDDLQQQETAQYRDRTRLQLYGGFALGALVILAAGFILAQVGDAIAVQTGIGSTLIGAVLLAVATSLPEISTTSKAVRLGAYSMAISNVFGSNAFNASLLFLGDVVYRPGPILEAAADSVLLLTGLTIFATCAHLWGMLERKNQTILGMGVPSAVVLVTYIGAIILMYSVM
jgi:cation:H+ antiporter